MNRLFFKLLIFRIFLLLDHFGLACWHVGQRLRIRCRSIHVLLHRHNFNELDSDRAFEASLLQPLASSNPFAPRRLPKHNLDAIVNVQLVLEQRSQILHFRQRFRINNEGNLLVGAAFNESRGPTKSKHDGTALLTSPGPCRLKLDTHLLQLLRRLRVIPHLRRQNLVFHLQ